MFISEDFEWKRSAAAIKVMCLEESNLEGYTVPHLWRISKKSCADLLMQPSLTLITIKNCQMCKSLQSTVFLPPSIEFAKRSSGVVRSGVQI
jgi:hypothetical protein